VRKIAQMNYDKRWKKKAFFELKGKAGSLKKKVQEQQKVRPTAASLFAGQEMKQPAPSRLEGSDFPTTAQANGQGIPLASPAGQAQAAGGGPSQQPLQQQQQQQQNVVPAPQKASLLRSLKQPLIEEENEDDDDDDDDDDLDDSLYRPFFIVTMTVLQLLVFAFELYINGGFSKLRENPLGGVSIATLMDFQAKQGTRIVAGEGWRLFIPIFVHGGAFHIFTVLLTQGLVGWGLERLYGPLRMMPIYFGAGIGGNLLSALIVPKQVSCGAQGAVFGYIACLGVEIAQNWKRLAKPWWALFRFLGTMIVAFLFGTLPFIDNFAQLGGLIVGVPLAMLFLPTVVMGEFNVKRKLVIVIIAIILIAGYFTATSILLFTYKGTLVESKYLNMFDCISFPGYRWCDQPDATN
jgi:membrane associated rhomboid family serine protease